MAQGIGVNTTRMAWEIQVSSASQRLMLLAIAKYADQDGTAFPSVESLCADTCLNRKTAFKVLKELQEAGVIMVNKRSTNNGNCYSIVGTCPKNGTTTSTKNGTTEIGTTKNGSTDIGTTGSTKNGTPVVPKTVHEEKQEEKQGIKADCDFAQNVSDASPSVPEFGLTAEEVSEKPKTKKKRRTEIDFYGLSENLIDDWRISRGKAKITQTVVDGFKREAEKAGIDLDEAVRVSIERGWRGFKAEWLKNTEGKPVADDSLDKYRISRTRRPADVPEEDFLKGWC